MIGVWLIFGVLVIFTLFAWLGLVVWPDPDPPIPGEDDL
jgi:hypothetical protein